MILRMREKYLLSQSVTENIVKDMDIYKVSKAASVCGVG